MTSSNTDLCGCCSAGRTSTVLVVFIAQSCTPPLPTPPSSCTFFFLTHHMDLFIEFLDRASWGFPGQLLQSAEEMLTTSFLGH